MNLDGTVLSLQSLELPRLEAVLELMFLAAYADGSVATVERDLLRKQAIESTHHRLSEATIDAMLTSIEDTLAQQGREARFESIKRRLGDPKMRAAALATAAAILLADHNIDASEAAWMVRAAQALEVTVEEAVAILRETQRQARASRG